MPEDRMEPLSDSTCDRVRCDRPAVWHGNGRHLCDGHAPGPLSDSCGNVKVYLRPFGVMWATCRDGVLVDTFLAGTPCPHHEVSYMIWDAEADGDQG